MENKNKKKSTLNINLDVAAALSKQKGIKKGGDTTSKNALTGAEKRNIRFSIAIYESDRDRFIEFQTKMIKEEKIKYSLFMLVDETIDTLLEEDNIEIITDDNSWVGSAGGARLAVKQTGVNRVSTTIVFSRSVYEKVMSYITVKTIDFTFTKADMVKKMIDVIKEKYSKK